MNRNTRKSTAASLMNSQNNNNDYNNNNNKSRQQENTRFADESAALNVPQVGSVSVKNVTSKSGFTQRAHHVCKNVTFEVRVSTASLSSSLSLDLTQCVVTCELVYDGRTAPLKAVDLPNSTPMRYTALVDQNCATLAVKIGVLSSQVDGELFRLKVTAAEQRNNVQHIAYSAPIAIVSKPYLALRAEGDRSKPKPSTHLRQQQQQQSSSSSSSSLSKFTRPSSTTTTATTSSSAPNDLLAIVMSEQAAQRRLLEQLLKQQQQNNNDNNDDDDDVDEEDEQSTVSEERQQTNKRRRQQKQQDNESTTDEEEEDDDEFIPNSTRRQSKRRRVVVGRKSLSTLQQIHRQQQQQQQQQESSINDNDNDDDESSMSTTVLSITPQKKFAEAIETFVNAFDQVSSSAADIESRNATLLALLPTRVLEAIRTTATSSDAACAMFADGQCPHRRELERLDAMYELSVISNSNNTDDDHNNVIDLSSSSSVQKVPPAVVATAFDNIKTEQQQQLPSIFKASIDDFYFDNDSTAIDNLVLNF